MIGILDFGLGNIFSIHNMLKRIGVKSIICTKSKEIELCDRLILPGVGSFDKAIKNIKSSKLLSFLEDQVLVQKKPILGICLGMQILLEKSEEGKLKGLGWVEGKVVRLKSHNIKIPHMGWNKVVITRKNKLLNNIKDSYKFYFVHSYVTLLKNKKHEILETYHGEKFTSSFCKKNIYGVQFHPEKSHKYGIQLLKNFANL